MMTDWGVEILSPAVSSSPKKKLPKRPYIMQKSGHFWALFWPKCPYIMQKSGSIFWELF